MAEYSDDYVECSRIINSLYLKAFMAYAVHSLSHSEHIVYSIGSSVLTQFVAMGTYMSRCFTR